MRCTGCSTSIIHSCAANISAYIESLDPSRLVTLGDEGWLCGSGDGSYVYQCGEGVNFARNLNIATFDYATFHLYLDSSGYNESSGNTWILEHNAVSKAAGKPVVLEEYGALLDTTLNEHVWQKTAPNRTGIAADLFWQFGSPDQEAVDQGLGDDCTITYGTVQYAILCTGRVESMLTMDVDRSYG